MPRDGELFLTHHGFISVTFGYLHPRDRVIFWLKYIGEKEKSSFKIPLLDTTWTFEGQKLFRPKNLFSPETFKSEKETFKQKFPEYLYYSPYLSKEVFAVPKNKIKKVFSSKSALGSMIKKDEKYKKTIYRTAVNLIRLLSSEADVSLDFFGIRGSLLLEMAYEFSDIDITVFGKENFFKVKESLKRLVAKEVLGYLFENEFDKRRKNKGIFNGKKFVITATRLYDEIYEKYGDFRYIPLKQAKIKCEVTNSSESVFRPAKYFIKSIVPLEDDSSIVDEKSLKELVSMNGQHRDFLNEGDQIVVKGMLESKENTQTGEIDFHIVVGSEMAKEYIKILNNPQIVEKDKFW